MGPGLGGMHGKGCCCSLSERRSHILETGREIFLRSTCRKVGKETVKNTKIQIHVIFAPFIRNINPQIVCFIEAWKVLFRAGPENEQVQLVLPFYRKVTRPCMLLSEGGAGDWQNFFYGTPKMGGYFTGPTKQARLPTT